MPDVVGKTMIRIFLYLIFLLQIENQLQAQIISDRFLHYKTDFYWDTSMYKSVRSNYFEMQKGYLIKRVYPVIEAVYNTVKINGKSSNDSVIIERRQALPISYKYELKNGKIYLLYFDKTSNKIKSHLEYSLNNGDTINGLINKNTINSEGGISVEGQSIYLGDTSLIINDLHFICYKFREIHEISSSHPTYYELEVYLTKNQLIPVLINRNNFDYNNRRQTLYTTKTSFYYSTNLDEDYSSKTSNDLILFRNPITKWTSLQREYFLNHFPSNNLNYAKCLLDKIDGVISFYEFESDTKFKALIISNICN